MRATQARVALSPAAADTKVAKAAARELIVASLLTLTDQQPGPLDMEVTGDMAADCVELRVQAKDAARTSPLPASTIYQALDGSDVEILAAAHGIDCACVPGAITLRFPASTTE
jgi:hypothetical protein